MLHGVLALLERSLRVDARTWPTHLARLGLMACIYISLSYVFARSVGFGAPGLRFFQAIIYLNLTFMTLLGIGFFSTAISEEKEEDTLGLIQMAGISPLGIVLGKTGARIFQAMLLIAVQYPFTLLAVTMGGVSRGQVTAAFVGLTAYMFLLAGVGLICSTVSSRSRFAGGAMTLVLITHFVVSYAALESLRRIGFGPLSALGLSLKSILQLIGSSCIYLQSSQILTSSFSESPWSVQAISNLVIALFCFVASVLLFGVCTRSPSSEAASRGLVARSRGSFRWFSPGRPQRHPFLWKDFHFIGGGMGMVLLRLGAYFGLILFIGALTNNVFGGWGLRETIGLMQFMTLAIVTIETAYIGATCFHEEIRGQTISTLIMLPIPLASIVLSKVIGSLIGVFPGFLFLGTLSFYTIDGWYHTEEFLNEPAGWFFLSHFVLVPHLAMFLALYMRWGAVPASIGVSVGSVVLWVTFFQSANISPRDSVVGFVAFLNVCVSLASYALVNYRVHVIAQK